MVFVAKPRLAPDESTSEWHPLRGEKQRTIFRRGNGISFMAYIPITESGTEHVDTCLVADIGK